MNKPGGQFTKLNNTNTSRQISQILIKCGNKMVKQKQRAKLQLSEIREKRDIGQGIKVLFMQEN